MSDFTKFVCFVKGVLETGYVIKHSDKKLRHDIKLHFNRLLNDATQFEKFLHRELSPDMVQAEDEINSMIISLVWQIFDMPKDDCERFFNHINSFDEKAE